MNSILKLSDENIEILKTYLSELDRHQKLELTKILSFDIEKWFSENISTHLDNYEKNTERECNHQILMKNLPISFDEFYQLANILNEDWQLDQLIANKVFEEIKVQLTTKEWIVSWIFWFITILLLTVGDHSNLNHNIWIIISIIWAYFIWRLADNKVKSNRFSERIYEMRKNWEIKWLIKYPKISEYWFLPKFPIFNP